MQDWNFLILGAWPLGLQRGNYLEGTKTVYNALVLMELNAAFNLDIYSYIHLAVSAASVQKYNGRVIVNSQFFEHTAYTHLHPWQSLYIFSQVENLLVRTPLVKHYGMTQDSRGNH